MWQFARHAERMMFQACPDRAFQRMWIKRKDQSVAPRYRSIDDYDVQDKGSLAWCQYAYLTSRQVSCFIVLDCDQIGPKRDHVSNDFETMNPHVLRCLEALADRDLTPAWIGVNPTWGKCQLIWYIEKVYNAEGRTSPNRRLMRALHGELNELFGGDKNFSHGISRWPFFAGDDLTAYRWHNQHHTVVNMKEMIGEVRTIMGKPTTAPPKKTVEKQYSSGWERIEAARAAATQGRMLAELDKDLLSADDAACDLVDGVRVRWIGPGCAARDETAFRHALAEGHRLHAAGKPMKDNLLIDAYERAYTVAQAVGADGREPQMPPMRDRLTMARRVRGYVVSGKSSQSNRSVERQSSAGRKALATMGRRGGKKAAQRWEDPDSDYAKDLRAKLAKANQRREMSGELLETKVKMMILDARTQGVADPTTKEIAKELSLSIRRVQELRKELGLTAKRGRPSTR